MDARKTWKPALPNELCELQTRPRAWASDNLGAELGMKAITRNARHWSEAAALGFAQNSHWCATFGPSAPGWLRLGVWAEGGCSGEK